MVVWYNLHGPALEANTAHRVMAGVPTRPPQSLPCAQHLLKDGRWGAPHQRPGVKTCPEWADQESKMHGNRDKEPRTGRGLKTSRQETQVNRAGKGAKSPREHWWAPGSTARVSPQQRAPLKRPPLGGGSRARKAPAAAASWWGGWKTTGSLRVVAGGSGAHVL